MNTISRTKMKGAVVLGCEERRDMGDMNEENTVNDHVDTLFDWPFGLMVSNDSRNKVSMSGYLHK